MHGRGKMAAAPASEAAQRGDVRRTPLPARRTVSNYLFIFLFFRFWIHADSRQFGSDARQTGPIRAKSDRIGRISVCVGRQKEIDWREKK